MLTQIMTALVVAAAPSQTASAPSVQNAPSMASNNPEMTRIYDEDQAARSALDINWPIVGLADAKRRDQTKALIAAGGLHTGQDFEYAAFVFQHGDFPNDYLLAHTLALVALEKGRSKAVWIATATLDRYLQNIGQKQIYGTQFQMPYAKEAPTTQDPYDRTLVSDPLRQALHVPTLAEQDKQRAEMEAGRATLLTHRVPRTAPPAKPPSPSAP